MSEIQKIYLKYTQIIDYDPPPVRDKAQDLTKRLRTDREKAVALYYFVRDNIRHNAYAPLYDLDRFRVQVFEKGLLAVNDLDGTVLEPALLEQAREDDEAFLRIGHSYVKGLFQQ